MEAKTENNLIIQLRDKFLPYWPLFIILLIVFLFGAWIYLKYATPIYEASASIIIKDEKKGSDESKISESLNYLSSKKIVENEIEVLRSNSLMKQVVKNLSLYSSVYEVGKLKPKLLYATSPIKIDYQNIDTLLHFQKKYFSYNDISKKVKIDESEYPVNEWVNTPLGFMKFISNPQYSNLGNKRLFFTLSSVKGVASNFTSSLNVTSVSKLSSVISLTFADESPERAVDVLKQVLLGYNKILIDEKINLASNTSAFVEDRLKYVRHDLDSIERKIQQYKSGKDALDISSQGKLFLENVSSNDQKLSDINMQMAVLKQVQNYILSKNNSGGIVPSTLGVNDPLLSQLLNKLYDAELQYEKLKKTTAENNPILKSITDEINKIKPSILENIQNQQRNLLATKTNLYNTNGSYSANMQAIPQKERDLVSISREYSIKSNIYNFLLQKREEAGLSYVSGSLNNKIVNEPESSQGPVSPKKNIIYSFAIIMALSLAILCIVIKHLLNSKILSKSDIEDLTDFPVVGEISLTKANNFFVIEPGKRSLISEQFRKLRTSLWYMGITGEKKKILITSTIAGEGKSFITINLGLALALADKKVILLELDLINPTLSDKLNTPNEMGITNFLKGECDEASIIKESSVNNNLSIISSGLLPDNPSELIMNGKIKELFSYLEDKFDYIIVDTAPVIALSDAYILTPFCDTTLYIVRHNYTPKAGLKQLDENNKIYELKNVRIVYNGIDQKKFGKSAYSNAYNYKYSNNLKTNKQNIKTSKA